MNQLFLSTEPEEFFLGIVYWGLVILGIVLIVKFFQIAKDVRSIQDILEDIARSLKEEKGGKATKTISLERKIENEPKETAMSNDESNDLIKQFFNESLQLYKSCDSKEEFESKIEEIIAKYTRADDSFDYSTLKKGLWEQLRQL